MLRDAIQLHATATATGSQEKNVKKYYHYHFIANCFSSYIATAPVENMTALNWINAEETGQSEKMLLWELSMLYVFSCVTLWTCKS